LLGVIAMAENKMTLMDEMSVLLAQDVAQRHSYFQLKYFLIGKEPTNQSKMWQCLRELKSRKESLKSILLEREDLKDKLELLDINAKRKMIEIEKNNPSDLSFREMQIGLRQIDRQIQSLRESLLQLDDRQKWIEEESRFFLETFKNLQKIEPLRNFDDLESQKQYWNEKLSQKVNLKMLTQNTIDSELIETIVALPDDVQIKKQTLQTLTFKHNQLLQQFSETTKKIDDKEI
jgi:hypothetical protein